jgi:hypothetical protein
MTVKGYMATLMPTLEDTYGRALGYPKTTLMGGAQDIPADPWPRFSARAFDTAIGLDEPRQVGADFRQR